MKPKIIGIYCESGLINIFEMPEKNNKYIRVTRA